MAINLDHDLAKVIEFTERNVETGKLGRVAEKVAVLAPVLWVDQEFLQKDRLITFTPESFHEQLATATESAPEPECGCGGSVVAEGSPLHL